VIVLTLLLAMTPYGMSLWLKHKRKPKRPVRPAAWIHELDRLEPRLLWGRARVEHWRGVAAIHDPREMIR
jgi:hypothetical protein